MSEPFQVSWWRDEKCWWTIVRLRRGNEYVEVTVTDEVMVDAINQQLLAAEVMQTLVDAWNKKFGQQLVAHEPVHAGEGWRIRCEEDYVEGEVIEEAPKAIEASQRAIGR